MIATEFGNLPVKHQRIGIRHEKSPGRLIIQHPIMHKLPLRLPHIRRITHDHVETGPFPFTVVQYITNLKIHLHAIPPGIIGSLTHGLRGNIHPIKPSPFQQLSQRHDDTPAPSTYIQHPRTRPYSRFHNPHHQLFRLRTGNQRFAI